MAIAKKIESTPILPNFNTNPFLSPKLILEGSYTFVLFLQWIYILTNELIYKMSILEEIIPILVLKWYFKLGILHPHCLWILLIWAGFLIRWPWFVTGSKFYHQKESLRRINSISKRASLKKLETSLFYQISILFETRLFTKHFLQKIRYVSYVRYHNNWRSIWYLCGNR